MEASLGLWTEFTSDMTVLRRRVLRPSCRVGWREVRTLDTDLPCCWTRAHSNHACCCRWNHAVVCLSLLVHPSTVQHHNQSHSAVI